MNFFGNVDSGRISNKMWIKPGIKYKLYKIQNKCNCDAWKESTENLLSPRGVSHGTKMGIVMAIWGGPD